MDLDRLTGFRVKVSPYMQGAKRAFRVGEVIHVSPAMYDLMSHADEAELARLLAAIPLVDLNRFMPPARFSVFRGV